MRLSDFLYKKFFKIWIRWVPKNIISLTCDAFGVLPPVARLTAAEAVFYFLSGFTSKVAGTEEGIIEPVPTFSTCFGAPFMPQKPEVYDNFCGIKLIIQIPMLAAKYRMEWW